MCPYNIPACTGPDEPGDICERCLRQRLLKLMNVGIPADRVTREMRERVRLPVDQSAAASCQ